MSFSTSIAERKYLEDGVAQGVRTDGRGTLDYRHFVLETVCAIESHQFHHFHIIFQSEFFN